MARRIDWEDLLHGDYTDVTFMLSDMYQKISSTTRLSEKLGISRTSLITEMRRRGIQLNCRGGDTKKKKQGGA